MKVLDQGGETKDNVGHERQQKVGIAPKGGRRTYGLRNVGQEKRVWTEGETKEVGRGGGTNIHQVFPLCSVRGRAKKRRERYPRERKKAQDRLKRSGARDQRNGKR